MTGKMSENSTSKKFCRLIQAVILISTVLCASSCVPLLIGGVVGYVARGEGFGVAAPLGSGGGSQAYDSPAAYGDTGGYDAGAYDEPVY